ncbi:MAG: ECF transporter S component [Clostridia bacterium]|nr:ECF transporter S component [Clostridia bacterium]
MSTNSVSAGRSSNAALVRIVFGAVMAAIICVITLFRIPLGQSKVHFANAMCLLAGLLLGPVTGGLSAGLGSALYDVLFGGYDFLNAAITFVSKFAMAWVTAMLYGAWEKKHSESQAKDTVLPLVLTCAAGALTYVALYMLKTWIFKMWVEPVPADTIPGVLVAKLVPSLINAAFALAVAPIFYHAVRPALKGAGIWKQLKDSAR